MGSFTLHTRGHASVRSVSFAALWETSTALCASLNLIINLITAAAPGVLRGVAVWRHQNKTHKHMIMTTLITVFPSLYSSACRKKLLCFCRSLVSLLCLKHLGLVCCWHNLQALLYMLCFWAHGLSELSAAESTCVSQQISNLVLYSPWL